MKKLFSLAVLAGTLNCSQIEYTPKGIMVLKDGYNPDMEMIDTKYEKVEDCVRKNNLEIKRDKDSLLVHIVTDQDAFPCRVSRTGYCAGLLNAGHIDVTESLSALAHESAHYITRLPEHQGIIHECGYLIDNPKG